LFEEKFPRAPFPISEDLAKRRDLLACAGWGLKKAREVGDESECERLNKLSAVIRILNLKGF
jgi:hypothetical protein